MTTRSSFSPLRSSDFTTAFTGSTKVHVEESGVRVPMREIALTNGESLRVYDSSGPQGCDPRIGLPQTARRLGVRPGGDRHGHATRARAQGDRDSGDAVCRGARRVRSRVRPVRGRARPRDHSGQRQPHRARADDHRPQLRGEDQRQHRQLGGLVVDRRGSREAAMGDAVGGGYGDGPLDRGSRSTKRASGSSATPPCRSARCRSTRHSRRSEGGRRI